MSKKSGSRITAALLILVAVVALFLIGKKAGRSPSSGITARYADAKVYSTWDKYLKSQRKRNAAEIPAGKVVFIGMDGATWRIFKPLIGEGKLPAFKRLMEEGSYGVLRSGECYVSPPAWVSMMTGMRPEHTGIYTFGRWDEINRKFVSYTSDDVSVPSVWDIASLAGKKVAVTNIAVTYPAHEVNGLMVTGMLTPIMIDDKRPKFVLKFYPYEGKFVKAINLTSYSPVLRSSFNLYTNTVILLLYDSTDDNVTNYDRGVVTAIPSKVARKKGQEVVYHRFDLDGYSPWIKIDFRKKRKEREGWCQIKVNTEKLPVCEVRVSAVYFTPDDPEIRYTYPEDFRNVLKDKFSYYFPYTPFDRYQIDDFVKDAAKYATFFSRYDNWDLFMYTFYSTDHSQHVFGDSVPTKEVYKTIDRFLGKLLDDLTPDDILVIASDHGFKHYKYSLDLNTFFADVGLLKWNDEGKIDHDSTVAFYNMWTVYFNHALLTKEELAKRGIEIPPGKTPREALIDFITEKGKMLVDPESGRSMPVQFVTLPEGAVGVPPDLIVNGGYTDYLVEFWDRKNPHKGLVRELREDENWNHERDGIFFVWGRSVKHGFNAGVKNIEDIAPTILYAMNLPLAGDLDGVVMQDVFSPEEQSKHPVILVKKYAEFPKRAKMPEEERQALEKKLKSLGYIK